MRVRFSLVVLILSSLACGTYITPTPEAVQLPTATPLSPTQTVTVPTATAQVVATDQQTAAVVQAVVNVRNAPDGDVIGYLSAGDAVTVLEIAGDWAHIADPDGWVFAGCLSIESGLGCQAK